MPGTQVNGELIFTWQNIIPDEEIFCSRCFVSKSPTIQSYMGAR